VATKLHKKRAATRRAAANTPRARDLRDPAAEMDALLREITAGRTRKIAVFLGAGASKIFGYPLTSELMGRIFGNVARRGASRGGAGDSRRQLIALMDALLPGKRRKREIVPTVTSVLSLLDFSLMTGQALLPSVTIDQTRRARQGLQYEVLKAIPDDELFEDDEVAAFTTFCGWLAALKKPGSAANVAIITTNYDMLSDVAAMELARVRGDFLKWDVDDLARKIDFGFRWVHPHQPEETFLPRPRRPGIALYKLHGSTNWLRCPLCENVYINPNGPIGWLGSSPKSVANLCHCSETQLEAQIVSPSFVRELREPNVVAIWKSALDFLREAEHWVIIGYSFPDEDVAIRALFTRAFGSRYERPRVSVVQLDEKARVNYASFFPADSLRYVTGGMELLLKRWETLQADRRRRR